MDCRVRTIRLSRNFGHQTATTAGLEHASGDAVVLIDADLQDPPKSSPRWSHGGAKAITSPTAFASTARSETRFKLATAKAFYRLLNRVSETEIPLDTGTSG